MILVVLASISHASELAPPLFKQFPGRRPVVVAGKLPALKELSPGIARLAGDAGRLPFAKESFAASAALGALGESFWPWTVLAELRRTLRPAGRLLLFERAGRGGLPAQETRRRLERAGFEVESVAEKLRLPRLPGRFYCVTAVKK